MCIWWNVSMHPCLIEIKEGSLGEPAKHNLMLHWNTQHRKIKVTFFVCICQVQARFNSPILSYFSLSLFLSQKSHTRCNRLCNGFFFSCGQSHFGALKPHSNPISLSGESPLSHSVSTLSCISWANSGHLLSAAQYTNFKLAFKVINNLSFIYASFLYLA